MVTEVTGTPRILAEHKEHKEQNSELGAKMIKEGGRVN